MSESMHMLEPQQLEHMIAAARAEGERAAATRAVLMCLAAEDRLDARAEVMWGRPAGRDAGIAASQAASLAESIAHDANLDFHEILDAHNRAQQVARESGGRESADNAHGRML